MKVVVTGGDGFIGSNLAEDLRYSTFADRSRISFRSMLQ